MNRDETMRIMALLRVAYPAYYRNINKVDADAAVNLWSRMFEDDDYSVVTAAVEKLVVTRSDGFPPTIGEVKSILTSAFDDYDEQKAWHLASSAAAGNIPWEKLPPTVQRAIGSKNVLKEWGMIDVGIFSSVIYSQFVKSYKTCVKRERDNAALPERVRSLLADVSSRMELTQEDTPELAAPCRTEQSVTTAKRVEPVINEYKAPTPEEFEEKRKAAIQLLTGGKK